MDTLIESTLNRIRRRLSRPSSPPFSSPRFSAPALVATAEPAAAATCLPAGAVRSATSTGPRPVRRRRRGPTSCAAAWSRRPGRRPSPGGSTCWCTTSPPGGWFWHLREHPAYDYATRLALRGETSLVLDRLGYDESPLARRAEDLPRARRPTCSTRWSPSAPRAFDEVVLHGHSVGAAIAELEAATFDDVDGLVLMSWPTAAPRCARSARPCCSTDVSADSGSDYAPYGRTERDFRELFSSRRPADVVRPATDLRNQDPCGDALSLDPNQRR